MCCNSASAMCVHLNITGEVEACLSLWSYSSHVLKKRFSRKSMDTAADGLKDLYNFFSTVK